MNRTIILNEKEIEVLKELLFRLNLSLFKEYVAFELSTPNATSSQIRDVLISHLELAGLRLFNKKEELKKFVDGM